MLLRDLNLPPNTKNAERLLCQLGDDGLHFAPVFGTLPMNGVYLDAIEFIDYTKCGKYYEFSVYGVLQGRRVLKVLLIISPERQLLTGRIHDCGTWRDATQADAQTWIQSYVWDKINL